MEDADVVVVGAGLAGLRAARVLAGRGRSVLVLEAAPVVGGRQRTDAVDGFLLDRGFQVLNPAYPAVRRWVDLDDLRLRSFPVGVRVRTATGVALLGHPLRHPAGIPATLSSGLVSPKDAVAFARWLGPALIAPRRVISGSDRTLREGWDAAGLRGRLRTDVLEPFLAGVVAESSGDTSDAFARLLMRMFALGAPAVPERGIAALPAHLARAAGAAGAVIRLDARVGRVSRAGSGVDVDVVAGDPVRARAVIVAVGPEAVGDLVDVPRPTTRGLQTWWFAAERPPTASALVSVDARRAGPVINTVVMSNAAPSYAPAGRHLIQATCLLPADPRDAASEQDVRRHLAGIWGAEASEWTLLRRDDLPHALPAQPPPLSVARQPRVGEGVYVAGDHRDTASIQGALVSGDRVARAVLQDLETSVRPIQEAR